MQGGTIWLLTGQGSPRRYYLVQRLTADRIESGKDEGFHTRIASDTGDYFRPMLRLNEEEWLPNTYTDADPMHWEMFTHTEA